MKANEFIKKFGLLRAKQVMNSAIGYDSFQATDISATVIYGFKESYIPVDDLKHLIESHKLVERFGGLEKAMDIVINQEANGLKFDSLARAIADVESCQ